MNVAFMGCSDFEKVKRILVTAKSMLGEVLSGQELHCALLRTLTYCITHLWYTAAYYTARFRIFIVYMWCNATCTCQDTAIFSSCEAFEFMDSVSMEIVEKHLRHRNPISAHPFYVLVETSGSHEPHDKEVGGRVRWASKVGM